MLGGGGAGELASGADPTFGPAETGNTLRCPELAVRRNPSAVSLLRFEVLLPDGRDQITSSVRVRV